MLLTSVVALIFFENVYGKEICPMSSIMDLNNNNSYFYPIDIYGTPGIQQTLRNEDTFPCYAPHINNVRQKFNCSTIKFCPVDSQNVVDATQQNSRDETSMCYLKSKLSKPSETVRIIVMGDSVVHGHNAQWCRSADDPVVYGVNTRCAWPYHFGQWLNQSSVANVEMYNIAMSGHNSLRGALNLVDLMKEHHLAAPFTSNDFVILDYGTGDDHSDSIDAVERGMEYLIQRIYSFSRKGSWPTIVMIDDSAGFGLQLQNPKIYPTAYKKIANHYNISIWSYREAVHSDYTKTVQTQYVNTINFKDNNIVSTGPEIHPPWHVHLFMADLYSAIWTTKMSACTDGSMLLSEALHNSPHVLPVPVFKESVISVCGYDDPVVLSMSYDEVKHNKTLGTFSVSLEDTWKVREDVKDRGGFVVDRSDHKGKMGELAFHVVNTTTDLLAHKILKLHFQFQYLRTYENAGLVQFYVCGVLAGACDALWQNYETNRVSIPEFVTVEVNLAVCAQKNFQYATIEFSHMKTKPSQARGDEKFKIINIKGCIHQKA